MHMYSYIPQLLGFHFVPGPVVGCLGTWDDCIFLLYVYVYMCIYVYVYICVYIKERYNLCPKTNTGSGRSKACLSVVGRVIIWVS